MLYPGSFKIRGVINQLRHIPPGYGSDLHQLVSMSAGNYGKAFAYMANKMGLKGTIIMPDTAPDNREALIKVRMHIYKCALMHTPHKEGERDLLHFSLMCCFRVME